MSAATADEVETRLLGERPTESWRRSLRRWFSVKPDEDVVLGQNVISQRIPQSDQVAMEQWGNLSRSQSV